MTVYLKLILTAIFWGGTFIAGRVLASEVGPFCSAFLRFAVASLLLLILVRRQAGRLPALRRTEILPVVLLGATGVFAYNTFFFKGLKLIEAGRAALIIANNPIFITLFAAYFFKERLNWRQMIGIVLSVSGAVLAISKGHLGFLLGGGVGWGDFYIFSCVLSWVAYSLIGKAVMNRLTPLASVFHSAWVGTVALLIPAWREGLPEQIMHCSGQAWASIGYLGLFGTVLGFVWYYEGIQKIGASKASLFINFVPISAILMAYFILHEPLTASLFTGALLVTFGVYLTNTARAAAAGRVPTRPPRHHHGPPPLSQK
jgi:drug/metabolite transporter (DMT)-like permease